jgi:hypothetical protein
VDSFVWSLIEVYCAILCGCLISMRPLFVRFFPQSFRTAKASVTTSPYDDSPMDRYLPSGQNREDTPNEEEMMPYSYAESGKLDNQQHLKLSFLTEAVDTNQESLPWRHTTQSIERRDLGRPT